MHKENYPIAFLSWGRT